MPTTPTTPTTPTLPTQDEDARPPGWDAGWEAARQAADAEGVYTPVRISAEHRGAYHAIAGGKLAMVELRGRHYRAATDKRDLPAVGDFCLVSRWQTACSGAGSALIEAVLPRRSLLVRRAAGVATAPQPLAANVDLALIVTSANSDLSAQRLDRYLELVRDGGIAPLIVMSKLDLATDAAALLASVATLAPGVPVIATSVPMGLGFDRVQASVGPGRTAILLGSSGVGKSSILNALAAGASALVTRDGALAAGAVAPAVGTSLTPAQSTGPIREHDDRGRHTTTVRQLFTVPDGSIWIDTPGMRELAAFADGDPDLAFEDVAALAATCRFADCQHRREPGCAVVAAITAGTLTAARLASYQKLRDERARDRERRAAAAKLLESRAGQRATARSVQRKRPGRD